MNTEMSDTGHGCRFLSPHCHGPYTGMSCLAVRLAPSFLTRYPLMRFLISLFTPRPHHRSFALLDRNGRCQAFKQCSLQPMGEGWVEIDEIRLNWLHQPLPASARVQPLRARARNRQLLTI